MSHSARSQIASASGAAVGGGDVEIFRRQPRFQQLHVGRNVVDDKNAGGHDCTITAGPRKWRMVSMNLPTEIGFDR